MIFVTVGTHSQQFDRLLKKIDELAGSGKIKEEVVAQSGNSTYVPKHFKSKKFYSDKEFENLIVKASIVVSHGGAGAIILALKHKKKLVLVPRLKGFGEHMDSHQVDLAEFMQSQNKAVFVLGINELEKKIVEAKKTDFSFESKPTRIVNALNEFFGVKN